MKDITDLFYIEYVVKYLEYKGEDSRLKEYYREQAIKTMCIYGGTFTSNSELLRILELSLK